MIKRISLEFPTRFVLPFLPCFLLLLCCHSVHEAPSLFPPQTLLDSIRPEGIRAHMAFLSDDLLEGRAAGTRGHMLAAKYIQAQFEEMGLKPAGERGSYFQNVRLRRIETPKGGCRLVEKRDGKVRTRVFNKDFVSSGSELVAESSVEAPLVFVGYGVTAPEFHYDDYADVNVKDKIVVLLTGAPAAFPSAPRGVYSGYVIKARNAAAHGAVGLLTIWAGPRADRVPFTEFVKWFREPNMRWLNSHGVPSHSVPEIKGWAWLSEHTATEMFDHAQKSLKQALADAAANKPQAFLLPLTVSITQHSQWQELTSPNVAAILPGSDPKLKDQYLVFTAHADHVGIGDPVNGDTIYNGAIDNASGTAAMLEIARALSLMPTRPRRSILFIAVTGEEEGLLGSDYYAQNPTVPLSQIVANVNIDGVTLLYDFRDIVAQGAEHSSIAAIVSDVAQKMSLEVSPDPLPEEAFFIRSDQYSFVKQGIPAVYVSEGFKTVDPKVDGKKLTLDWEATYYHTPKDDMNQPNLNFEAAVKCTRVIAAVSYELSQQTERPHWNQGDFFTRFVKAYSMSVDR
jgi:hypothetical protein